MPQGKIHSRSGFTLVEIMITIVIIVLLSQSGSILNLFQAKANSELESISVSILNTIDEQKTLSLLGKTDNHQAVIRQRKLGVTASNEKITYTTSINRAGDPTSTYIENVDRNTLLGDNSVAFATCDDDAAGTIATDIKGFNILFSGDTIGFEKIDNSDSASELTSPHIVISIGTVENKREIHVDRRTGLTYERAAPDPATISCK